MITEEQAEEIRKKLLEQIKRLPEEQAGELKKQIEEASAEELEAFVSKTQGECIFCEIVKGEVETVKIYEDAHILAILDLYPASKGHLLVMPREHFCFIDEIPDFLLQKLFVFVKVMQPILKKVTQAEAMSIYIAQGELAGQRVPHFCINMIPRFKEDKILFEWQRQKVEKEKLEEIAQLLRSEAQKELTKKLEAEIKKEQEKKKAEETSKAEKIAQHIKPRIP